MSLQFMEIIIKVILKTEQLNYLNQLTVKFVARTVQVPNRHDLLAVILKC